MLPIGSTCYSVLSKYCSDADTRGPIVRIYDSYFDYEMDLGKGVVAGFLRKAGLSLDNKSVLDIGCGEGGILAGLAETYKFRGLGIDYDGEMISKARQVPGSVFRQGEFFLYDFDEKYDFILLRDVLEHCGNPREMLRKISTLLRPGGFVYITYTPYLSPFGGHQHNGSGFFSNVPFIHLLPESVFLSLIKPKGNFYKASDYLVNDLKQIRKTWLTTSEVKRLCEEADLNIDSSRAYFVRPDYKYKFGLPTIPHPLFMPVNTVSDIFCTCVEMLLSPGSASGV